MVSLTFSITPDDYAKFYTYMMWDGPQNAAKRRRYYIRQLIPPLIFLAAFYYTGLFRRDTQFILLIGGFLVLTMVLSLMNNRNNVRKMAEKIAKDPGNEMMFREHNLQASDNGLVLQDPTIETRYQWKAFTKKLESQEYYFLFLNNIQALIIPKRVFTDAGQQARFDKLLSQHLSLDAEVGHLIKS